jgi:hypothetical protein
MHFLCSLDALFLEVNVYFAKDTRTEREFSKRDFIIFFFLIAVFTQDA